MTPLLSVSMIDSCTIVSVAAVLDLLITDMYTPGGDL